MFLLPLTPSFSKANKFMLRCHHCSTFSDTWHSWKASSLHLCRKVWQPSLPSGPPEACSWQLGSVSKPTSFLRAITLQLCSSPLPTLQPSSPGVNVMKEGGGGASRAVCVIGNKVHQQITSHFWYVTHKEINLWTRLEIDDLFWCSNRNLNFWLALFCQYLSIWFYWMWLYVYLVSHMKRESIRHVIWVVSYPTIFITTYYIYLKTIRSYFFPLVVILSAKPGSTEYLEL